MQHWRLHVYVGQLPMKNRCWRLGRMPPRLHPGTQVHLPMSHDFGVLCPQGSWLRCFHGHFGGVTMESSHAADLAALPPDVLVLVCSKKHR
jgi:hypothetical protein